MMELNSKSSNHENDLKIAVVLHPELIDPNKKDIQTWMLYNYNQKQKLELLFEYGKSRWGLDPNGEYGLLLTPEKSDPNVMRFVNEDNRNEIDNGMLIFIYHSPGRLVQQLLEKFESVTERQSVLEKLLNFSHDPVFVAEFEKLQGFQWLMNGIQNNLFQDFQLCIALEMFLKIMEHDIIRWTKIGKHFIDKLIQNIINQNKLELGQITDEDRKILVLSLSILEASTINCAGKFVQEIEKQLPLPNLNNLLKQDKYPKIQQNVLALINSILYRTDLNKRRAMAATLSSRQFKDTILQYIVNQSAEISKNGTECDKSSCGSEITHQLYVLQTHLLQMYEEKMNSGSNFENARDKVMEIRNNYVSTVERDGFEIKSGPSSVFRSQSSIGSSSSNGSISQNDYANCTEDFERLGFANITQPWEVFYEPPGALVLDFLHYFSKVYTDAFVRFVIENSSPGVRLHSCPLVVASFRLTGLLCDLMGIGKPPRDEGKEFYPMLFDTDKPLEEFFSIGLSLFNRTWHEIHATSSDIDIVCDFLQEKLRKTLANSNATNSFESFKKELSRITYAEINRRWNEERQKRDKQKEELPAIKELKSLLKPEMLEIVRQHRLNYLVRGTRFDKYTAKGQRVKDKFWYCRLSSNHKTLLYGECDEECKKLDENLVNKLNISDIHQLVTGKECPHMRDTKGKKSTTSLAFALILKEDTVRNLCFVAPKTEVFDYWVDGINALLEREMDSQESEKDAEMLLELDIKLRLLDIEGLSIPEKMPELPPSPPNYEFSYRSTLVNQ